MLSPMIKIQDPYKLGYTFGLQGEELPDEHFSLFSWAGWIAGIEAYAEKLAQAKPKRVQLVLTAAKAA